MMAAQSSSEVGPVSVREAHTLVIGAGPSGLAAAYRLLLAGLRPVVLERSMCIGGLMRSIGHGAFRVDLGRKELYTRIPEVDALWRDLLGDDYRVYPHRVGSLYGGRILEMSGAFRGLRRGMPLSSFLAGAADLGRAWLSSGVRRPRNCEDYWYQRAGRRFARAFAQGYWEKFRGQAWRDQPVPTVHADGQRSGSYSFGAIAHGLKLAAQGGPAAQRRWQHPAKGSGQICERLAERLRQAGVEIQFGTEAVEIVGRDGSITDVFAVGPSGRIRYRPQNIVSSLQVEALVELLGGTAAAGDLRSDIAVSARRTVVLVYLFLDEAPRFPHAWLEVNDTDLKCGRITNYAAFNGDMVPPGKTALCIEYFLNSDSPMLRLSEEEWIRLATDECRRSALIDPTRIDDSMLLCFERCNAAASWRESQEAQRLRMFEEIRPFANLYHVNRPGTDWATFAGLMAGDAIAAGVRHGFDLRADPTRSYAASQQAA